ncbi:Uncharacterised protein [Mycobacteroides abscessus subsp. abscessus]|nr:Uncharacterised protein [Mycobacteroides abscessus subsp. abscessus]SIC91728.1 Uncharacterised protein [Mycobacteroides abscessus subsp. abscessus]SID11566.1 Uncharacterised protein [Mycobacteroides abscessus subsp. abscessus]SID17538.1 Uncharacterised protein [Mycobacteroides abscessus subsp. abscessus]SKV99910.1 Uncharacterised protein [Mycobacteroides abscessus subsp. abscessus]
MRISLPHRRRRCAGVAVLICTVLMAGGACTQQPGATSRPGRVSGDVVVYRSKTELGIVHGTTVDVHVPADFSLVVDEPVLTSDGRYAFSRAGKSDLVIVDVHDGRTRTLPLPKPWARLVAGENSEVLWSQDEQIMSLDLSQNDPQPRIKRDMNTPDGQDDPTDNASLGGVSLVAARNNVFLLTGGVQQGQLFVSRQDQPIRPLGSIDSDLPINTAWISPDRKTAVYSAPVRNCGHATVTIVNLQTGNKTTTAPQPDLDDQTRSNIFRLGWQPDGTLDVAYGTSRCTSTGSGLQSREAPSIWSYTAGQWTQSQPGPVLQIVKLPAGRTADLVPAGQSNSGALYIVDQGQRTHIADNVQTIATPTGGSVMR